MKPRSLIRQSIITCSRCGQSVEVPTLPRALQRLKRGDQVRVPRGTMVKRYGPDWPIKEEPAKRSMTVRVSGIHGPYDHAPYKTPRVAWTGRGGYERTALLSDLEEAS